MTSVTFNASPTCARFMKSNSFGRLIAGPVGSMKTTSCIFELFRRACEQAPAPDSLRYTRYAIVRQTLKQLKDTVLKDVAGWLQTAAHFKVSDGTIYVEAGDVRSEWLLIPLEDPEDQKRLLSMQLSGAWMSEAIEMDVNLVAAIGGRMPRYPSGLRGTPSWTGIIADTNFPTEGSDWHAFMEDPPPDWQIFKQPGGRTEQAENLCNLNQTAESKLLPEDHPTRITLGREYYARNARNSNKDWVRRYVDAEYGDDPSGMAVFRESFKHSFHVVDELEPVYGHALLVGQDFGRDPCSVICQVDHKGRLLVLQEVSGHDIGLELHVERSLRPALMDHRYLGKMVAIVGDPAGRAKSSIYESTSFDDLKRLGFTAFPAPTNDIDPRLRAVEAWLCRQVDGGPAMVINGPRCPNVVRALGGGYRYAKTKAGQNKPLPEKNKWSHYMDGLEYVCLSAHGSMTEMMATHMKRRNVSSRPKISAGAWT